MRFALTALLVMCLASCKDKPAEKKPPAAGEGSAQQRPPKWLRPMQTPVVSGTLPVTSLAAKIVVSPSAIELDEQHVMEIGPDGVIDREKLRPLTEMLEAKVRSDAPVGLALDATLTYRQTGVVIDVLRKAGFHNIALLTGSGGAMLPIELADPSQANSVGLRPVVTVQGTHVTLWSASGQEGTRTAPKASFDLGQPPSFAPLTHALAEIVQRRWPDGHRKDEDMTIILNLEGRTSTQLMMQALAAVRADGTLTLFPSIHLTGGR